MRISLSSLIMSVALLSVMLSLLSSITSGYRMSEQTLIANTLETNRVYAQKLAGTTNVFFEMTLQTLEVSAKHISLYMRSDDAEAKFLEEVDRLKNQTNTFNSVAIVTSDGRIAATSPQTLDLVGEMLDTEGGKHALSLQQPLVSKPYLSMTGRLVIFISQPIFDTNGEYLGLVGGSLYLKEENILSEILGDHYYEDGSYVYVVDEDGRIIYHKDPTRINELVDHNPVVQHLMNKKSGTSEVINSKNVEMLAGYAYVPAVKWGIVSQRPMGATVAPTIDMMEEMIIKSLPYLLVSIILILFIAKLIAHPLQKLAYYTESSTENNQHAGMKGVRAWYYEATQLKKALTYSLGFLHEKVDYITHQSHTDPLTKLANRRTLDEQTQRWVDSGTSFAIILLDIDHFKIVNDTFGHLIGDEVLKFMADRMMEVTREEDLCCRFGGEEFILLLRNMNSGEAFQVAERLRTTIENTVNPSGEMITISAGIASYPANATNLADVFDIVDRCLYEAKNTGRNRCVAMPETE